MPIDEKNLGKYKRPAIYIEEIDNSIIETPAQNVLINLVPGFSKKGPVNRPVYVDNKVDFERIFGTVDRQLENKGSYFHRTVEKMLETGPVWALNLLITVPNRDTLNYVDVSTSANYQNSDFNNPNVADYADFFNRQDFWERDSESFLDLVNNPSIDNERLLHLTNMGEKTITTFLFKSDIKGFDITASEWYGGDTKVPTYIHPKSLISDYMVTVLIISGDWTDYKTLSADSTWSKYFTTSGLITSQVQNFVNERSVITLGSYDVSLIPNFKDLNNNDMYIENVINNNTDTTGLFCTYNQELLQDNDYLSDLVDLIGDTLVGTDATSINFLSYNQSIKEQMTYPLVDLDSPNNVIGTSSANFDTRSHGWNNWTQTGISYSNFNSTSMTANYTLTSARYIINGVVYNLSNSSVSVSSLRDGYQRKDVIYLDSEGIHIMEGTETLTGTTLISKDITFSNTDTIILGTLELNNIGGLYTSSYVTITGSEDTPNIIASGFTNTPDGNYVNIRFVGTSGASYIRNYEYAKLRLYKIYNEMMTNLQLNKGVIISSNGLTKTPIIDPTSSSVTPTADAQIRIYVDIPTDYINGSNQFIIYYIDKEFKMTPTSTQLKTTYTYPFTNVVSKYSDFYQDYLNGNISNGDYIVISSDIRAYLKMYIDTNDVLTVNFVNKDDTGSIQVDGTNGITVWSDLGNWRQTLEIENGEEITDFSNVVSIKVDKDRYSEIKRGMYVEAYYNEDDYLPGGEQYNIGNTVPRRLTRIVNIKNDSVNTNLKIIYTDAPIRIHDANSGASEYYTTIYPAVYQYITNLKGISLKPFKIHPDSMPNGTESRQNSILNVMGNGTALFNGLINKNKIAWRYLIDSFGLGLTNQSKQQYLDICGKKLNCLGFISMPSAKSFKKSTNPSFTNDDGSLNTTYIKEGANQDKNPDFLYSFGTGNGRSTVGYFFPYVKITENNETRFVPPAANAATVYMRKHITTAAGVYPWTIAAGVNMGRVPDISGTEMDFTDNDLDNLSDMGCNPIVFIRNVGYIINDESTAQVYPILSLSYMHSREVLIELENELYDMLLRYQWRFNTPTIRAEIKYRADQICQRYVESDALYAFRNVCDITNNTNYIIDLQGGVLDTYVEIVKGMGWIVNNITIEKTGTINSTGFQQ